jgi:ATP-dependent Lhr-like helicase
VGENDGVSAPFEQAGPDRGDGGALPFSEPTRAWFTGSFAAPTSAQEGAWRAVRGGSHALVVAPTGSGKTLAAFLWALDRLLTEPEPPAAQRCRVLYVSPLKALAADVERNLRAPLVGIGHAAARAGVTLADVRVGTRTGDTPTAERRTFGTRPPDILITTPESLYLILTSAAREGLRGVRTVILDEVHAVAGSKRGSHLALSLERLDAMLATPAQRIGLSATVRPVEAVARFLAGTRPPAEGGRAVTLVQPEVSKELRVEVAVPVPDLADIGAADAAAPIDLSGDAAGPLPESRRAASIWPHVEERLVDLVTAHRSTIVFTNSRRGAERLTARMNEVWAARTGAGGPGAVDPGSSWAALTPGQGGSAAARAEAGDIARAHHGSMSREERTRIESELKAGRLRAVVATSSLELGIDMGAVDLVVQVGAPPSVASTLQRIGRAGHQVGALSQGVVLPTHRGDLLASTVTAVRAADGRIEAVHPPANPLDVLAQQVVAMVAVEDWDRDELARVVRRAAPFAELGDGSLDAVLDMLAGLYPAEDFNELRPRLVWDRLTGRLSARPGALRLAVTSGGTIPDRGLYGVYLAAGAQEVAGTRGGRRVGELDEEMVYESRVGDTFTLGSSTWRIEDITPDRVLVSPAPGLPGRLPFWRGDSPGRPAELGRALGAMVRELAAADRPGARLSPARARLDEWGLDPWAGDNLLAYLRDQAAATGRLPDDRTILLERFRDELGDWRLVVHSPWGARVHAPWALVLGAHLRERFGADVHTMHADDGIVLRVPDAGALDGQDDGAWPDDGAGPGALTAADLLLDPDALAQDVVDALGGSAHFAGRFREAAARSLLLPRRQPDRRQPLWQQRQRAARLLSVAASYPTFPVVLEAVRECLQDDFDVPALAELMREVGAGRVRVVEVTTTSPSPFAQSLLFGYVGQFIYDGDAPLSERRAAALALDPGLLHELLGEGLADVADLLDPDAVAQVEAEVGLRTEATRALDAEGVADLVRRLGPVTSEELAGRVAAPEALGGWLAALVAARRVLEVRVAGGPHWAVVEDAGRLRDALGVPLPPGLPAAVTEPVGDPLGDLLRRHARTHGPFTAADVAARLGLGVAVVVAALRDLERRGLLAAGRLRPGSGAEIDFCDVEVLRRIRRRSLAALRAEVEPVPEASLGVFLPRWQNVGSFAGRAGGDDGPGLRGAEGVVAAVEQLAGARIPASALDPLVLAGRVRDYAPAMLDELVASGEVVWVGAGALPGRDGVVVLAPGDLAPLLLPVPGEAPSSPVHEALLEVLRGGGGYFFRDLAMTTSASLDVPVIGSALVDALWDLVWAGLVTNDSLAPLRARLSSGPTRHPVRRPPSRVRPLRGAALRLAGTGLGMSSLTPVGTAPPEVAGRWSAAPRLVEDPTARTVAQTLALLDRHGVLTRGAVADLPGGFQAAYGVLSRLEETGQVRRGYVVEGLGGAQFGLAQAIERLRAVAREPSSAVLLAATDPANPYGAALPWPERPVADAAAADGVPGTRHRPGRTAGACVVLVDGALVLYVERGGRTLLSFSGEPSVLGRATRELAVAAGAGALGRLTVQRADGAPALRAPGPLGAALAEAGFIATPRGLRLRHRSP